MSAKTSIEWTERTWNPLVAYLKREVEVIRKNGDKVKVPAGTRGWFCTKCSPGCAHCYAEKINLRLGNGLEYVVRNLSDIEFRLVNLDDPLRWRKPCMVFVNSMTDLFHDHVPAPLIDQVFAAMHDAPRHTFQILTKRARRMRAYMTLPDRGRIIGMREEQVWPFPNIWLGVSTENQNYWNERVSELIKTPAAIRFVSAEPLLGPIDMNPETHHSSCGSRRGEQCDCEGGCSNEPPGEAWTENLDWLICGGESGSEARPMHPDWARALRDQCTSQLIPFFFKQWGEFEPGTIFVHPRDKILNGGQIMHRVGKKRAGRLLDGREWNQMPEGRNGQN